MANLLDAANTEAVKTTPETQPAAPEQAPEKTPEAAEIQPEATPATETESAAAVEAPAAMETAAEPAAPKVEKPASIDPGLKEVEDLIAQDLKDVFLALPEDRRPAFKKEGEEIAKKIKEKLDSGNVKRQEVLDLSKKWLGSVSGENKYFLENHAIKIAKRIAKYAESKQDSNEI